MKRIFLLLAFMAMILPAFSERVKIDKLYYNLDSSTKTAEVTYAYDHSSDNRYYVSGALSIPETVTYNGITYSVTSIGVLAFSGCSGLTSATIGNSVKTIGFYAFSECSGLTSVEIPNSVTSIASYAFEYCSSLTSVVIPNSVTSIVNYAFEYCSSLTSVVIPNSVTSIGNYAFFGCNGLTNVEIPNSVTSIGKGAFSSCSGLKCLYVESGNKYYASKDGILYSNNYETLVMYPGGLMGNFVIPNSVTSIGESAFMLCSGLTSVTIPNSVTSIGDGAFYECSGLTSVIIPNSVTSIASSAFRGCSSLTSVEIPNSVTSIGDEAFHGCSGLTSVEIPNSVTSIGSSAFYGCWSLTSVEIPISVASIGNSAFAYCSGLTSIEIPNSVTSIGNSAFAYCSGLTSVEIPNSVASIGDEAFYGCWGLTSIEIPNSVTSIGNDAFYGCALINIILESETPPSYYSPFSGFVGETTLTIPDKADINAYLLSDWGNFLNMEQINGDKIFFASDDVFEYRFIESLGEAYLVPASKYGNMTSASIPDRVVADRNGVESFYKITGVSNDAFKNCTNLTQVKLPANCEVIGSSAFSGCSGLTSVEIPNSVTTIGTSAFSGCSGLTSVTISNSVTSIGTSAFSGCKGLTSVEIPNSVTSIGFQAFEDCSGLTSVTIPKSVTSIGSSAFSGCTGLTSVNISDLEAWCRISFGNATANPIYYAKNLYLNNDLVTSLSIPASISEIKNYAFYNCQSITGDLLIPGSVNSIGTTAFANIEFDDCIIDDGVEVLEFTGDNKINAKNLYLGRTINGPISYSGLDSLEVSGFVESIPSNCFSNNPLTSLVINPGSGIVIEDGAFKGCKSLAEITLPEDITDIGANAFSGTALKNITIPNGTIGANAFANCNLDNIIIGAGVESIGEKAFDGCNAIKNVYATPTTPPNAENNTFSYYEAQLYVPHEAIDTYYNFTRCWYRFSGKPLVMPEKIEVSGPETISGNPGETFQLTATISPWNVTLDRVLWTSTNPAIATVDNDGLVTIHNFVSDEALTRAASSVQCQIIASTLYEDSPVAVVSITANIEDTSIDYINPDESGAGWQNGATSNDIFTLQGVCLKRNASQSDIDALVPGLYIIGGKIIIKN